MQSKRLICPEQVRHVPKQFSWVDQRLVREGYMERCDATALALYLFLITVADAQGLSFYSDKSIIARLSIDQVQLIRVRKVLVAAQLIAFERPLYQVLALGSNPIPEQRVGNPQSLGAQLRQALKKRP